MYSLSDSDFKHSLSFFSDVYSSLGCFEIKKKFLGNVESVHACFAKANKDMYKVKTVKALVSPGGAY